MSCRSQEDTDRVQRPLEFPEARSLDLRRPAITTPAALAAALTRPAMLAILWIAAGLVIWNICEKLPQAAAHFDFSIYYLSAIVARDGGNPYTADFQPLGEKLGLEVGDIRHATDPPTFLALNKPLARLSEKSAFYAWSGVNAILLVLALMLLLGGSAAFGTPKKLALAALAFLYPPVGIHFLWGQSKIPVLFLLAAMIRLMDRAWDRSAGLCLAFASLLRVFPIFVTVYFAIQRRWRVLQWALLGIAAGALLTVAAFGLRDSESFLFGVRLLVDSEWLRQWGNVSVRAGVSLLIWSLAGLDRGAGVETFRRLAVLSAEAALLGLTIRATLSHRSGKDEDWRTLSMWIVASILLSPTAWVHYAVLCLIMFAQLVIASEHSHASRRAQWTAILSYVAMMIAALLEAMSPRGGSDSGLGLGWPPWLMAALKESWFAAAALAYLAAYWFAVDGPGPHYELYPERDALSARQGLSCVTKTRKRRAVSEMKEDPSEPPCRGRLQTAISCFGQKPRW